MHVLCVPIESGIYQTFIQYQWLQLKKMTHDMRGCKDMKYSCKWILGLRGERACQGSSVMVDVLAVKTDCPELIWPQILVLKQQS